MNNDDFSCCEVWKLWELEEEEQQQNSFHSTLSQTNENAFGTKNTL